MLHVEEKQADAGKTHTHRHRHPAAGSQSLQLDHQGLRNTEVDGDRIRLTLGLHRNADSCRQTALGLGRTVHSQIMELQHKAPQIQGSLFFCLIFFPAKYIVISRQTILYLKVEFHP